MKDFPTESIDCVVTDPPYGLSFMGKEWDKALPDQEAFKQMFRVLKPGALAFVMSSPRQDVLWRMLKMLEECGFQLKQSFISWIYKTGFPKAYDVSKGIDIKFIREAFQKEHGRKPTKKELKKLLREKRKVVGKGECGYQVDISKSRKEQGYRPNLTKTTREYDITEPAFDLAKKWNGWKSITGLKPAFECILMVNKPLSEKTIVDNVLKYGTGAINVDACRIPFENKEDKPTVQSTPDLRDVGKKVKKKIGIDKLNFNVISNAKRIQYQSNTQGRFPANFLVSNRVLGCFKYFDLDAWAKHYGFLDVPKASKSERNKGVENLDIPEYRWNKGGVCQQIKGTKGNYHPTVKPIKLMAYLIELGCPKDGIVLDPFVGSGTTCIAAKQLNRKWIGIELNPGYAKIASTRLGNVEVITYESREVSPEKETKTSNLPRCTYKGNCAYRTPDGFCTFKKYCKEKEK